MGLLDKVKAKASSKLSGMLNSRTGNAPVQMMLGKFKFSILTAALDEFSRSYQFRWPGQELYGKVDALQFTGYGPERWVLPCVMYPDWHSVGISGILEAAPENKPNVLFSSAGDILGVYVIESIEQKFSYAKPDGNWRKIEFTMTIRAI